MPKENIKRTDRFSKTQLKEVIDKERRLFEKSFDWLREHMPASFFEEFTLDQIMTIAHNLMSLDLSGPLSQVNFEGLSIVICPDEPGADLSVLSLFRDRGIRTYKNFVSDEPPELRGIKKNLRIAVIYFTKIHEKVKITEEILSQKTISHLLLELKKEHPALTENGLADLLSSMNAPFIRAMNQDRLMIALRMILRAKTRDNIQYEAWENSDYKKTDAPSFQIVFAWRNTQKYNFLYKLAKLVDRRNLIMKRMNAAFISPHSKDSILVMSIGLDGKNNTPAHMATDIKDFLRELATLKYFPDEDLIEETYVKPEILSGNFANLLRSMMNFVHQLLLHADPNLYREENIEEALCCHIELTKRLCKAFEYKFDPEKQNTDLYQKEKNLFLELVDKLDTGNVLLDTRRKNILSSAMYMIEYCLKNNFYRNNKSTLTFRMDPHYLTMAPFGYSAKFPELPFAVFFVRGMSFTGFHIRFKDLSRGGVRTIFPRKIEQAAWERINIFSECYNLAFTQQKKNKDIPEGGSKGVIFIEPFGELKEEEEIFRSELTSSGYEKKQIDLEVDSFREEQRKIRLLESQRAYFYSILTLINTDEKGNLVSRDIVDNYKKPEYLYFGPDENMSNEIIDWLAEHSQLTSYALKKAVISSKPKTGINHKACGVTSYGVNVCMHKMLEYQHIDPTKDSFTVKISGGPDGDVGGNQILNLYKYYPNTAKLLAITDVSGTIYDPKGLHLKTLAELFEKGLPISSYDPGLLHNGGYLLDMNTKKDETAYVQHTLCYQMHQDKLIKDWLPGHESHFLYRHNLHQVKSDIFLPCGGRPRTLSEENIQDFLDPSGEPTSMMIVEGANLYLTSKARLMLEEKGALIVKDSSANKGGVIASSMEVLCGLIMEDEEFIEHKDRIIKEILEVIKEVASKETSLLLQTTEKQQVPMSELSDLISKQINTYTYQLLDHLTDETLSNDPSHPMNKCLINYCLPVIKEKFSDRILTHIPDIHKKAIIACSIASKIVYDKGLSWSPSIVNVLPTLLN